MVIIAIIFQMLMLAIGIYGTVKLELGPMILNAVVCCSFSGAYIIYFLIIDSLYRSDAIIYLMRDFLFNTDADS